MPGQKRRTAEGKGRITDRIPPARTPHLPRPAGSTHAAYIALPHTCYLWRALTCALGGLGEPHHMAASTAVGRAMLQQAAFYFHVTWQNNV